MSIGSTIPTGDKFHAHDSNDLYRTAAGLLLLGDDPGKQARSLRVWSGVAAQLVSPCGEGDVRPLFQLGSVIAGIDSHAPLLDISVRRYRTPGLHSADPQRIPLHNPTEPALDEAGPVTSRLV